MEGRGNGRRADRSGGNDKTRQSTRAAQAAKIIRTKLTAQGLTVRVTSRNFSMGDAVDVHMTDQTPEICELVQKFCGNFQSGHFDGMTDCYEYSNGRTDLPQAKFVHVSNQMSDAMREAIYQHLRGFWGDGQDLPATYAEGQSLTLQGEWVSQLVHRQFSRGDSTYWQQRRQKAA